MVNRRQLEDYCTVFYEITNCPIHMYDQRKRILDVPEDPFPFLSFHEEALWQQEELSYVVSDTGLFFARIPVSGTEMSLVIGPFLMNIVTEDYIYHVIKDYGLLSWEPEEVADYLRSVASGILVKAVSLIRMTCLFLNQHMPEPSDLISRTQQNLQEQISKRHAKAMMQAHEEESFHNSYNFERIIYDRLQKGDVDFFRKGVRSQKYQIGKMADTSLRQAKNTFIVSVALATRAAVAGGLDEETAYQLSDEYIQTVEKMISLDAISTMSITMMLDYVERVQNASIPFQDVPEDIGRSIQYIRLHTNSNLSVQEVADKVDLSRSHLSHKFKEVMGFDISEFIMRCKLEEAKSLLMYSEQSIMEISNYLCFSSQSYFTSVFRKKYGMTPKEFRQQYEKKFIL